MENHRHDLDRLGKLGRTSAIIASASSGVRKNSMTAAISQGRGALAETRPS